MEPFGQGGDRGVGSGAFVILAIAIPVEVEGDFAVTPRNLHDVDLGSVPSLVAHLAPPRAHHPKRGPMARLPGHPATRHIVAEGVLELALRVDGSAGVAVAVLPGAEQQCALAAQVGVFLHPKSIASLPVAEPVPLRLVHLGAGKFVLPDDLPLLPGRHWRQGVFRGVSLRVGVRRKSKPKQSDEQGWRQFHVHAGQSK